MIGERNKKFSILLCLGIIFVVIGHVGGLDILNDWFPIYSFHIPLFFFISGYFYKEDLNKSITELVIRKIKKFIYPYFLWNFLYYFINILMVRFDIIEADFNFDFYHFFVMPFQSGGQLPFFYNAAWFILTLFLMQCMNIFLRKIFLKIGIKNEIVIILLYLLLGIGAVWISRLTIISPKNYLFVIKPLFVLPFYNLGYLYHFKLEKILLKVDSLKYILTIFILQMIILTITNGDVYFSVWDGNFINSNYLLIAPYIIALPGIFFYLKIAELLVPVLGDNKLVVKISQNTFSIMLHHQFIIYCINFVFYLINGLYPLSGFDLGRFRTYGWYKYEPIINFSFVYLCLAIVGSIYIKKIAEKVIISTYKIRKYIKNINPRILIFLFFLTINLISSFKMKNVSHTPDEPLTIAYAAYLAGFDWSEIISEIGNYYGYGYSMLLYPLFILIKNSVHIYVAISCFNSFMMAMIPVIAYTILDKYIHISDRKSKILTAAGVGSFPMYLTMSKIAMNEAACMFYPWVVLHVLLITINSNSKRSKYIYSYLVGVLSLYGYLIHGRLIGVFFSVLTLFVLIGIIYRKKLFCISTFSFGVGTVGIFDYFLRNYFLTNLYKVSSEKELRNTFSETILRALGSLNSSEGIINILRGVFSYLATDAAVTFGLLFVGVYALYRVYKEKAYFESKEANNFFITGVFIYVLLIFAIVIQAGFDIDHLPVRIYERYTTYLGGLFVFFAGICIFKRNISKKNLLVCFAITSVLFIFSWLVEFVLNVQNAHLLSIEVPTLATFIFKPNFNFEGIYTEEFLWAVVFVILIMFVLLKLYKDKYIMFYMIIFTYLAVGIRGTEGMWVRYSNDNSNDILVDFFDSMSDVDQVTENIIIEPDDKYPYIYDSLILLALKDYNLKSESGVSDIGNYDGYMISREVSSELDWKYVVTESEGYNIYLRGEELERMVSNAGYEIIENAIAQKIIFPNAPYTVSIQGMYPDRYWCTGSASFVIENELLVQTNQLILETYGTNKYVQEGDLIDLNLKIKINDSIEISYDTFTENKFTFNLSGVSEKINKIEILSNTFTKETDRREFGIDLKKIYFK